MFVRVATQFAWLSSQSIWLFTFACLCRPSVEGLHIRSNGNRSTLPSCPNIPIRPFIWLGERVTVIHVSLFKAVRFTRLKVCPADYTSGAISLCGRLDSPPDDLDYLFGGPDCLNV